MPTIDTLVPDIEEVLRTQVGKSALGHDAWAEAAWGMVKAIAPRPPTPGFKREEHVLYPTELGEACLRKLWYKLHSVTGEKTAPASAMMFAYGHLLEEVLLTYASLAGHTVESRQVKLAAPMISASGEPWLVRGKIDAVIDGVVVDVKTCSNRMFQDLSGYHRQVAWYGLVGPWERAGILALHKANGRLRYEDVPFTKGVYHGLDPGALDELDGVDPPPRPYEPVPTTLGERLPEACLFCPFKFDCWPSLRAFQYSFGPDFYVSVAAKGGPRVREMSREEVESAPLRG